MYGLNLLTKLKKISRSPGVPDHQNKQSSINLHQSLGHDSGSRSDQEFKMSCSNSPTYKPQNVGADLVPIAIKRSCGNESCLFLHPLPKKLKSV